MNVLPTSDNRVAKLASGSCPLVQTTVFTAAGRTAVLAIDISNPTGVIHSVTVWINGVILFSVAMPAFGGVSWSGPQILDFNQTIQVVAGAVTCNYYITGYI